MPTPALDPSESHDGLQRIYLILRDTYGPQHWWPGDSPFEIMIGAVLTQHTAWPNVERAIARLRSRNLLDPERLWIRRRILPVLIRSTGYYRQKSRRLLGLISYLMARVRSDTANFRGIPTRRIRTELLALHGIGPETADAILLYALGRPVFVIDAYTRRIFSRHRFFAPDRPYEEIRALFEKHLPRRPALFNEYHALIVRLGKDACRKHEPLCHRCPLRRLHR